MTQDPKVQSSPETPQIGTQLFAALTQSELAHLLDAVFEVLSPDRVETVLDQLDVDTRETVQMLLAPSNAGDTTDASRPPSVSLSKLEQTWSDLWRQWGDIVDEAAQEDGTYVVQEHHWEAPYFDSTTLVDDLERVAEQMRPLLHVAFENEFHPDYGFIDALLEADTDIGAAMPEWIYLDDGYDLKEHITTCLLEWEWLRIQEEEANAFRLAQAVREWEEESPYASLSHGTFLQFFKQLADAPQQQIFAGLTADKDTPLWQSVLTNTYSHWHALYMYDVERYAPERYIDNLRPTIAQRWENGLPVIESYLDRQAFEESLEVVEETLASLFRHRRDTLWSPETSLLVPLVQGFSVRHETAPYATLLQLYQRTAQGLGQRQLVHVLDIQLHAFTHCFDWQQMLSVFDQADIPEDIRHALLQSWRDYIIELTTPTTWEFGRRQRDQIWWLHWLFDSIADAQKGPTWFQQHLTQWLAQLPDKQDRLEADLEFLRLLTKDAWEMLGRQDHPYPQFFDVVIDSRALSNPDDASRRAYLQRYAMDDLWDQVMAYWRGNLQVLVPKPERAEKSIYTGHARWMAALQELVPSAYTTLLKQWQEKHKRRSNLWKAMANQGLT